MWEFELWRKLSLEELKFLNCGVGEDSWESLGQQGDKPVNPKGNQSWIFIGRTDAEAEAPILWPPDLKNWLTGKGPDAGKDWRQEEKGSTEDKMFGWHHWLKEHEFEQTQGFGDAQGSLTCCIHGVTKSWTWLSDWTELNWTEKDLAPEILNNLILCFSALSHYIPLYPQSSLNIWTCSHARYFKFTVPSIWNTFSTEESQYLSEY